MEAKAADEQDLFLKPEGLEGEYQILLLLQSLSQEGGGERLASNCNKLVSNIYITQLELATFGDLCATSGTCATLCKIGNFQEIDNEYEFAISGIPPTNIPNVFETYSKNTRGNTPRNSR